MALIGKKDIEEASDFSYEDIEVKEWGGTLRTRSFTANERLAMISKYKGDKLTGEQASEFYCDVISTSVIDEDAKSVFSSDDTELLRDKDWNVLERVAQSILKFNGMLENDVEETAKN